MKKNISPQKFLKEKKSYLIIGQNGAGKSVFIEEVVSQAIEQNIRYSYMPQISEIYIPFDSWLNKIKKSGILTISNSKIQHLIERFEANNFIHKKIKKLSDGQVAIMVFIQTLLIKTDLYIFDEFTNGMDLINRKIASEIIIDMKNSGHKILICSHDRGVIDNASMEIIEIKRR